MARSTKKGSPTRAGKAKPAKSVPRKKPNAPSRQAARPSAKSKASPVAKGKSAKRSKPKTPKQDGAAKPKHDAAHEKHMAEVRSQVARRRPGMGAPNVPHEHQDPSGIAPPGPPVAPVDGLRQNWGDTKEKAVTRMDNPTNWYRQAPKPPQKK